MGIGGGGVDSPEGTAAGRPARLEPSERMRRSRGKWVTQTDVWGKAACDGTVLPLHGDEPPRT